MRRYVLPSVSSLANYRKSWALPPAHFAHCQSFIAKVPIVFRFLSNCSALTFTLCPATLRVPALIVANGVPLTNATTPDVWAADSRLAHGMPTKRQLMEIFRRLAVADFGRLKCSTLATEPAETLGGGNQGWPMPKSLEH